MLSRRAFVGRLAAGAAAVGAVGTIAGRAQGARSGAEAGARAPAGAGPGGASGEPWENDAAASEASAAPWALVAPLRAGAELAGAWRLAALGGVSAGSCVATLEHAEGRAARVHLCRNTGRPSGVVHTARYDLVVMNGGDGAQATDEGLARALVALAAAVERNEAQVAVGAELLGHAERVAQFGASARLR